MQAYLPLLAALAAGSASALAFAPLDLWPLAIVGLAVLMQLLIGAATARRAALLGWLFGIGHFAVSLNWIATAFTFQAKMPPELGWLTVLGLSMYLALFVAAPTGLAARLARKPLARTLLFVALWGPAEWLRGTLLTGFAWNPVGAIWLPTPVAQIASVIGGIGLSLITLACAMAVLWLVRGPSPRRRLAGGGILIGTGVLALVGDGMIVETDFVGTPLVVVQPGIGQDERYDAASAERRMATYLALTRQGLTQAGLAGRPVLQNADIARRSLTETDGVVSPVPPSAEKVTGELRNKVAPGLAPPPAEEAGGGASLLPRKPALVVWPEGAIDDLIEIDAAARTRVASVLGPADLLLTGGTGISRGGNGNARYANSLFALAGDGRIVARYDKAHLVPLGEYVPWRGILEPLGVARLVPGDFDFAAGPGPRTLNLGSFTSVSPMICYEIAFPEAVADRGNRPGWIVNVSNDAWFGAWGPPQHLAQARLRAIEEGLPIARATPTGISAVIDGFGRVRASLAQGEAGTIVISLPPPQPESLFVRLGLYPALVLVLLIGFVALVIERRQPPPPPRPIRMIVA